MAGVDLSIVIVSWNVRDLLRGCLESVVASAEHSGARPALGSETAASSGWTYEVFVVDNASTDGSPDMVCGSFPDVRVIANEENLGFTVANNQAMRLSVGRYVLLLNCDTEVVGHCLETMIAYMDQNPQVGGAGAQLLNPDGTVQSSRRRFPTLATALLESTLLQQWVPHNKVLGRYYMIDTADDQIQEVGWVVGACLMARRGAIEQVGLLDEGFFMYSEELDWCYRLRRAGWKVVYLPTGQVIHYSGKSSEQVISARHIHFQTSKVRFFRKHHGPIRAELVRCFILLTYLYQLIEEGVKWLIGHRRGLRASRVHAYLEVFKSGLREQHAHRRNG